MNLNIFLVKCQKLSIYIHYLTSLLFYYFLIFVVLVVVSFTPGANKYMWIQPSLWVTDLLISWQLTMYAVITPFRHEIALSQIAWNDNNLSNLLQEVCLDLKVITFLPVKLLYLIEWVQRAFIYFFSYSSHFYSLWSLSSWKKTVDNVLCLYCLSYYLSVQQRFRLHNLIQKHKTS